MLVLMIPILVWEGAFLDVYEELGVKVLGKMLERSCLHSWVMLWFQVLAC